MKYIKKIFNHKVLETMYLLAIFIYAMKITYKNSTLLEATSYQNFWIYHSIYLLCLPKVLLQKYNRKQLLASVAVFALAVVVYHFNPTRNMLAIPFVLVGIKDCDMKKVARIVFLVLLSFVIAHTAGYFYLHFSNGGTILNIPWFDRGPDRSTVLCKSYNNYGAITSMFTIQYLFLTDRNKKRYLKAGQWFILSIFFYAIGTSRTSLIISILSILYLLLEDQHIFVKNVGTLKAVVFISLVLFSVLMLFMNTESPFVAILDKLVTGRIYLSGLARKEIGISLFPQVAKVVENPIVVDNLVVHFIIIYGIILTAALIAMIAYFGIAKKQDTFTDYLLIVTYFWAVTEIYPTYVVLTLAPLLVMHNYYEKEQ